MKEQWHNLVPDEALQALRSKPSGLAGHEARKRLLEYSPNKLKGRERTPPALVFARQFLSSPLIYVLLVAAIIPVVVEYFIDAGVILGVLILNAVVGLCKKREPRGSWRL